VVKKGCGWDIEGVGDAERVWVEQKGACWTCRV
jgi:hypothetical protein